MDVGAKTIKLSEKNYICVILGKVVNLFYLGLGNDFLDITPKAQWLKRNTAVDKLNFIKIKNLCFSKDIMEKMTGQCTD